MFDLSGDISFWKQWRKQHNIPDEPRDDEERMWRRLEEMERTGTLRQLWPKPGDIRLIADWQAEVRRRLLADPLHVPVGRPAEPAYADNAAAFERQLTNLIHSLIKDGTRPTKRRTAQSLHLSVSTLRRYCQRFGIDFWALVDQVRHAVGGNF